jgi:hypothetical protein
LHGYAAEDSFTALGFAKPDHTRQLLARRTELRAVEPARFDSLINLALKLTAA